MSLLAAGFIVDCKALAKDECDDADVKCPEWASQGECTSNAVWQSWNDSMIAWDKNQWGLSWLNFYWIQIWTPQIVQINGASTSNPGQVSSKVLAANYTGQVYLWADFSFSTPFKFQYDDYPNDMQNVCFKFDDKRLLAVHFTVAEGVKNKEREATTDPFVSGWKIVDMDVNESPFSIEALSDSKRNPFDIQADNCELCVSLQRNAVYFTAEMLLPALITSMFTLSAVFFQLSKTQPVLLGFSVVSQILALILVSQRLPSFTAHTPTIPLTGLIWKLDRLRFDGLGTEVRKQRESKGVIGTMPTDIAKRIKQHTIHA
uniref:Neur_chan_LBD domain-containing protein n=1 Tax=Heterorhabditis bacteriophora TaxID=37862 RepID=A0A1I7XDI2_HETBA